MMQHLRCNILCVLTAVLLLSFPAISADVTQQRQDFRAAREAWARADLTTFARLLPTLIDYPLYGYLVYDQLQDRMDQSSDDEIQAFLARYADLTVATLVRNTWLQRLATAERWADFLANYRDSDDHALRCWALTARLATEQAADLAWHRAVRDLWLLGKRLPAACQTTFTQWRAAGGMSQEDVWQRITLAFAAGNVELAEDLSSYVLGADRAWVQVWAQVHRDPLRGLNHPLLADDSPRARTIVGHGIARIARQDINTASNRWQELQERYAFTAHESWTIARALALRAASNRDSNALPLLERLSFTDAEVRRARVRAALWAEDWPAVLRSVRALKPWERVTDRWRYWEARALEKLGQRESAQKIYRELAEHRGYHGFLAADRVGQPYAFNHRPLAIAAETIAHLETRPALVRAYEWFLLGDLPAGRSEWMAAISKADPTELTAIAQLAAQWQLPDRIIATLGRTLEEDDLVLRFPLPYQRQVIRQATTAGLTPATVLAIARQESIFMPDIRSAAGALGLMQLMPDTATQVARGLKIPFSGKSALLDPEYNLRLGSTFLAQMIKRHGSLTLAAAAYNAGPGRVKQWRPRVRLAADVWVESIPFDETRRYVRNILTYATIYAWRLNLAMQRLADAMPMVNP